MDREISVLEKELREEEKKRIGFDLFPINGLDYDEVEERIEMLKEKIKNLIRE